MDPNVQGTQGSEERTPSDTPFSVKEMVERKMTFRSHPVTPAAHAWLKSERLNWDQDLRDMLIRRAENEGQQLTLEVTKSVRAAYITVQEKEREEHTKLYDTRPDPDAPKEVSCGFTVVKDGVKRDCGEKVVPQTWNKVGRGEIFTHRTGPLAGKPIREGNYAIGKDEDGSPVAIPVCRHHGRLIKKNGGRVYPRKRAQEICKSKSAEAETLSQFLDTRAQERRDKRGFQGGRSSGKHYRR
jgi:hypothetical protein